MLCFLKNTRKVFESMEIFLRRLNAVDAQKGSDRDFLRARHELPFTRSPGAAVRAGGCSKRGGVGL
jgi:hypothetical protein